MTSPDDHGPSLHGGYLASLFIAASRLYFKEQYADLKQPDPIQMNVRYLEFAPPGKFQTSIRQGINFNKP